jgi:hypothetical protein
MRGKLIAIASLLVLFISCKEHPYNKLIIGRWKILHSGWYEYPNPKTIEFTKTHMIITDTIKKVSDSSNYTLEDNYIIFKTIDLKKIDTITIRRFNIDTIVISRTRLREDSMYFIKD